MAKKGKGLGRGLDALLGGTLGEYGEGQVSEVSIQSLAARADQPRKQFEEEALSELADSIRQHGLLQPLLVRPGGKGFEIIAGERRWRAAMRAGLDTIPVIVKEINDQEAAEISLIENLQREDLTVVEEALAYRGLIQKHGYTQEELAKRLGKSRAHIANTMRMLGLPEEVLEMLGSKALTAGHARAILALPDREQQVMAAREIAAAGMSVRETEDKVRGEKARKNQEQQPRPVEIEDLEDVLQKHFGTRVDVASNGRAGKITVHFYSAEELERVLQLLGLDK